MPETPACEMLSDTTFSEIIEFRWCVSTNIIIIRKQWRFRAGESSRKEPAMPLLIVYVLDPQGGAYIL